MNSDFNSDNVDEDDYDPFTAHRSDDESSSDFEEHKTPFSINGNSPTSSQGEKLDNRFNNGDGPLTLRIQDMYTTEFQKRGLPHAHILIFFHPSNKYPRPEDIDKIISVEVLDPLKEPKLYKLVKSHMVHGPCGLENLRSPCMKDTKCSKYYPKKIQATTIVDQDGYPVYKRRDDGHIIDKNGIILHNGHVVPHNPSFFLKYEEHINMKWCNQSTSIKYLFKYINKDSDRISDVIQSCDDNINGEKKKNDEIKQYLDCRYISPSEACWRIFSFSIHGRKPVVERLFFHMEGENFIYYKDFEQIGNVLLKPSVTESMFTAWFEANL
ncbi:hypothetical protein KIW84_041405 [Lathyrus oleraceus]|uniref:Helitron helicase-like domain-containing protein n=1 Tax=Pisum sativum TaxID=3888 RepID=A0A9D5AL95_PEA|nr:hypothetical protein KIW84_041405 [Pisum sativum]